MGGWRMGGTTGRVLLLLGLLSPLALQAAAPAKPAEGGIHFYRYVNDKGVPVIDRQGVPPEYIGKGYQILNQQGRVVEVVPPAPSAEERQRQLEEQARARSDAQLLSIYSSPEEVDSALQRKLQELDGVIEAARGNQQALRHQQRSLQGKAANLERSGRPVPADLVTQIDNLKSEQQQFDKDIARYQADRSAAEASFAADRARLVELLQRQPR